MNNGAAAQLYQSRKAVAALPSMDSTSALIIQSEPIKRCKLHGGTTLRIAASRLAVHVNAISAVTAAKRFPKSSVVFVAKL